LLLAIAATAAFNVNFNMNKSDKLSSIALANIEALADGEIKSGDPCYNNTRYNINYPKSVVCGTPCKYESVMLLTTDRSKCG